MDAHAELLALTDRLLHEHGEFDAIEWLIRRGWLDYPELLAWRRGERTTLQDLLQVPVSDAIRTLELAVRHLKQQGLQRRPRPVPVDPVHGTPLQLGRDPHFALLCSGLLQPPAAAGQGDLFRSSADRYALDALRLALIGQQPEAAADALKRLQPLAPAQAERYQPLLDRRQGSSADPPANRIAELEQRLAPLARELLGGRARDYLSPLWVAVAQQLDGRDFDPSLPALHASHAWMQAEHWRQAAASIEARPGWRDQPLLLARMAEIETGRHRIADARRWRLQLCWRFPEMAAMVLDTLDAGDPDRALRRCWQQFRDAALPWSISDFPAWLLLAEPQQRHWLPVAQLDDAGADAAALDSYRLLSALLDAPGDVDLRRALKARQPALLQLFLARRERGAL